MKLEDGYVPLNLFHKDHWSTFAYAETCMVDRGGFQVGYDGRMRQGRVHYRVMHRDCPRPKQNKLGVDSAVLMDPKYSTRLKDGSVVEGHDDWHCVQDLVNAGLLGIRRGDDLIIPLTDEVQPGVFLWLTPLGARINGQLRAWKAFDGHYGDFTPHLEEAAA